MNVARVGMYWNKYVNVKKGWAAIQHSYWPWYTHFNINSAQRRDSIRDESSSQLSPNSLSAWLTNACCVISDFTGPGQAKEIPMFLLPTSVRRELKKPCSACFVAAYVLLIGAGSLPAILLVTCKKKATQNRREMTKLRRGRGLRKIMHVLVWYPDLAVGRLVRMLL